MKRQLVLDENTIVFALRRQDHAGAPDDTCLLLLSQIERNCHGIIFGQHFWDYYGRHFRSYAHEEPQDQEIHVAPLLKQILANLDKENAFVADGELVIIDGLELMPGVDESDRDFVRAAASVAGSILVTTDGPLRQALERHEIPEQFGFQVCTPAEALAFAGPDKP